ncbi:MAG: ferritin [Bacteroidales bacterium]|jgi:ferritin|nr:ferritin [Bacteroidales bacterium]
MINSLMVSALNEQVNAELWSGYLYLSMSYDMDNKGFSGIAHWFAVQAREEFEHASRIAKYITSRDAKVLLKPISEVRQEWNSPKDAFEDTLMHEKIVTGLIHNLMEKACELKDYETKNMLQWFINEQIEEEETPRQILHTLNMIGSNPAALLILDKELKGREDD